MKEAELNRILTASQAELAPCSSRSLRAGAEHGVRPYLLASAPNNG